MDPSPSLSLVMKFKSQSCSNYFQGWGNIIVLTFLILISLYATDIIINIHITENVPGTHFYLWCLQPGHNEIWHEGGPWKLTSVTVLKPID